MAEQQSFPASSGIMSTQTNFLSQIQNKSEELVKVDADYMQKNEELRSQQIIERIPKQEAILLSTNIEFQSDILSNVKKELDNSVEEFNSLVGEHSEINVFATKIESIYEGEINIIAEIDLMTRQLEISKASVAALTKRNQELEAISRKIDEDHNKKMKELKEEMAAKSKRKADEEREWIEKINLMDEEIKLKINRKERVAQLILREQKRHTSKMDELRTTLAECKTVKRQLIAKGQTLRTTIKEQDAIFDANEKIILNLEQEIPKKRSALAVDVARAQKEFKNCKQQIADHQAKFKSLAEEKLKIIEETKLIESEIAARPQNDSNFIDNNIDETSQEINRLIEANEKLKTEISDHTEIDSNLDAEIATLTDKLSKMDESENQIAETDEQSNEGYQPEEIDISEWTFPNERNNVSASQSIPHCSSDSSYAGLILAVEPNPFQLQDLMSNSSGSDSD